MKERTPGWRRLTFLLLCPVLASLLFSLFMFHNNRMDGSSWNARSWAPENNSSGEFVIKSLLLSTVVLILLNTITYSTDAWEFHTPLVMTFCFFSLIASFAWALLIRFVSIDSLRLNRELAAHLNELIALALFSLFAVMDWRLYRHFRESSAPDSPAKLNRTLYGLQLAAVDLPVLVGILTEVVVSHFSLEDSPALGSDGPTFNAGFFTGAMTMHLAVSQVIFLVVYLWYFFQMRALKNQEHDGERTQTAIPPAGVRTLDSSARSRA